MRIFGADGSARIYADRSKADNGDYFHLSQTRQLGNKLNGARGFPSPADELLRYVHLPKLRRPCRSLQCLQLLMDSPCNSISFRFATVYMYSTWGST